MLRPSGVWPRKTTPSGILEQRWSTASGAGAPEYSRILELGGGTSSSVWVAVGRSGEGLCQLVVLKGVAESHTGDGQAVLKLMDEARLTARMNHPNVVRIQGLHREHGLPVIVMEYLAGQSLATLIACANDLPQFSLELRLAIVVRLLRGLDYAHRLRDFDGRPLRVVHGSVSPDNVVVTYDGEVKLVDFGRARVRVSRAENQLARRRLPYVAPEQLSGAPDLRGDVFSAGVILWELVAKRPLWGRIPAPTVVRRLLEGEIPRLREAQPTVDAELDRICSRALAAQPDGRYRSAGEMRGDLERYLETRHAFISDPAIGALVGNACREHRREAQKTIAARLSDLGVSLAHGAPAPERTRHPWRSWFELPERRLAAYLVGTSLVVAAMMWLFLGRDVPRSTHTRSPTAESGPSHTERVVLSAKPPRTMPAESKPASAALRLVRIEVQVRPSHAVLYIDGQRVSDNPLRASMVWDPQLHTLRSEAAGFEGFATTFRLDSDVKIEASLRPEPIGGVRRSAGRPDEVVGMHWRERSDPLLERARAR